MIPLFIINYRSAYVLLILIMLVDEAINYGKMGIISEYDNGDENNYNLIINLTYSVNQIVNVNVSVNQIVNMNVSVNGIAHLNVSLNQIVNMDVL